VKHEQVQVLLSRKVFIDAVIAPEIILINRHGLVTEASCQGPPPTALIRPSMVKLARRFGYRPVYQKKTGFYEIGLKTNDYQ
jgi:hypothetical protein